MLKQFRPSFQAAAFPSRRLHFKSTHLSWFFAAKSGPSSDASSISSMLYFKIACVVSDFLNSPGLNLMQQHVL